MKPRLKTLTSLNEIGNYLNVELIPLCNGYIVSSWTGHFRTIWVTILRDFFACLQLLQLHVVMRRLLCRSRSPVPHMDEGLFSDRIVLCNWRPCWLFALHRWVGKWIEAQLYLHRFCKRYFRSLYGMWHLTAMRRPFFFLLTQTGFKFLSGKKYFPVWCDPLVPSCPPRNKLICAWCKLDFLLLASNLVILFEVRLYIKCVLPVQPLGRRGCLQWGKYRGICLWSFAMSASFMDTCPRRTTWWGQMQPFDWALWKYQFGLTEAGWCVMQKTQKIVSALSGVHLPVAVVYKSVVILGLRMQAPCVHVLKLIRSYSHVDVQIV